MTAPLEWLHNVSGQRTRLEALLPTEVAITVRMAASCVGVHQGWSIRTPQSALFCSSLIPSTKGSLHILNLLPVQLQGQWTNSNGTPLKINGYCWFPGGSWVFWEPPWWHWSPHSCMELWTDWNHKIATSMLYEAPDPWFTRERGNMKWTSLCQYWRKSQAESHRAFHRAYFRAMMWQWWWKGRWDQMKVAWLVSRKERKKQEKRRGYGCFQEGRRQSSVEELGALQVLEGLLLVLSKMQWGLQLRGNDEVKSWGGRIFCTISSAEHFSVIFQ